MNKIKPKICCISRTASGIILVLLLLIYSLLHFSGTFECPPFCPPFPSFNPPDTEGLHNLTNFKWVRNNKNICARDTSSRKIVFLVLSGREYTGQRNAIRETWGSATRFGDWSTHLIFLLGVSNPKRNLTLEEVNKEDQLISEEYLRHGDIVEGNFVDSYRNLTYKTLMGYKWILDYCPTADFVVKTDDDYFIDVPRLLMLREEDLSKGASGANMHCISVKNPYPNRNVRSKYYVTLEEYPLPNYPYYCCGAMHGMTIDILKKMYAVNSKVKYLSMEDVFSGLLMQKAKMEYNSSLEFIQRDLWSEYKPGMYDNCVRKQCKDLRRPGKRRFGLLAKIPRDADLTKNMNCLWAISKLQEPQFENSSTTTSFPLI